MVAPSLALEVELVADQFVVATRSGTAVGATFADAYFQARAKGLFYGPAKRQARSRP